MKISNLRPHNKLLQYVDRYWLWEDEMELPKIVPGTGTELMFHFYEPVIAYSDHGGNRVPNCHILLPRHVIYHLKPTGRIGFIAVRFRAGTFHNFCNIPIGEMVDCFIDARHIWGREGIDLSHQVIEAKNLEQRIFIIEAFLLKCLYRFDKHEQGIDYMVNKIYYNHNQLKLTTISDELAISNRQFQRKFKESVGVSPKFFQRIARFEGILKYLLLNKQKDYLTIVLNSGYYDQSHFIKDFKTFTGEYPSLFLQEKNFMSHFYNKKLPACPIIEV